MSYLYEKKLAKNNNKYSPYSWNLKLFEICMTLMYYLKFQVLLDILFLVSKWPEAHTEFLVRRITTELHVFSLNLPSSKHQDSQLQIERVP